MKNYIFRSFFFLLCVGLSLSAHAQADSIQAAIESTISLTPTIDPTKKVDGKRGRNLFEMLNNRIKTVELNGVKNSVINTPSILTATGNTPYAGKFVRENGGVRITCFIDKQGNKHAFEGGVQTIAAGGGCSVTSNGAGDYIVQAYDSQLLSFNPVTKILTIQRGGSVTLPFIGSAELGDSTAAVRTDLGNNINYVNGRNFAQQISFPYRNFAAKYADVRNKITNSSLKIVHFGDSNTEAGGFDNSFKNILKEKILQKGAGWVSFDTSRRIVGGVIKTTTGFVSKSINNTNIVGLDLAFATSNSAGATCIIDFPNFSTTKDNSTFTNCTIYASGTGTFTAQIDANTSTTFALSNTMQAFNITVAEGRYKLTVTAGSSGQNFYGADFFCSSPSFNYYRLGASGRTYKEFATINQTALSTQLGGVNPNLILLNYGSNDFPAAGATAASIMQDVRIAYAKIKIAAPLADIAFVIPSDRNIVVGTALESAFADSLTSFAIKNNCNFYNLYKTYGYQPDAKTLGYFDDEVHFTKKGHELNAKMVVRDLTKIENSDLWERTGSNGEYAYFDGENRGGVQIGRKTATGGYFDVYNPLRGDIQTLKGNNNTYSVLESTNNSLLLQAIDGAFNRIASSQQFQIWDNFGVKYNSEGNQFTGNMEASGTIKANAFKLAQPSATYETQAQAQAAGVVAGTIYENAAGQLFRKQ